MKSLEVNIKEIKMGTKTSEGTGRFKVDVFLSLYNIPEKIACKKLDGKVSMDFFYVNDLSDKETIKSSKDNFDFFMTSDEGILTNIIFRAPTPEKIDSIGLQIAEAMADINMKAASKSAVKETVQKYNKELTECINSIIAA